MALPQPLWHLAANNLAGRRTRSALLVLAVALATVLTSAVASVTGTLSQSLQLALGQLAGLSDLQIAHRFNGRLDQALLAQARAWPQVALAAGRYEAVITVRLERTGQSTVLAAQGVEPVLESQLHPRPLVQGRMIRAAGEITLDSGTADKLQARLGDLLKVQRYGDPLELQVVGIFARPQLDVLQRRSGIVELAVAQEVGGYPGKLDQIDLQLRSGADAQQLESRWASSLPGYAHFRTPANVRANLNRVLDAAGLLLLVTTALVSLASGFIILTSLTTTVTERMRELAILRCLGASRWQIAGSQLASGLMLSSLGALLGVPVGVGLAWMLYWRFSDMLAGGFVAPPGGLAIAVAGALASGLLGAAYPAILAARVRPLTALAIRAREPSRRGLWWCLVLGLLCAVVEPVLLALHLDNQATFWLYVYLGLPLMFVGYFLLSAPLMALLGKFVAPLMGRLVRVPGRLLGQSVLATPFRHGFTAGALMMGLALLVAIWTGGRSVLTGYFADIRMPDAFVHSYNSLSPAQWQALRDSPAVSAACPTTMFPVKAEQLQFGVHRFSPRQTLFVSCDPAAFIGMVDLQWIQGDPASALERMKQGRAVLVSREYQVAHGIGKGAVITLQTAQGAQPFEVAGVVGSSGLDVAVHFFGIHRAYSEAAVSAIFGTREDASRYFQVEAINLVLLSIKPGLDDQQALAQIRRDVPGTVVGSSRGMRAMVVASTGRFLALISTVSVASLLIACLGVGNLIAAEVAGRRFEYGVLRAIGTPTALLGRLVLGQTLLVGLTGCVAGLALGVQLAMVARVFHIRLAGLQYAPSLPWDVMAWGCLAVLASATLAAGPAIWHLIRQSPRALLASGRAD